MRKRSRKGGSFRGGRYQGEKFQLGLGGKVKGLDAENRGDLKPKKKAGNPSIPVGILGRRGIHKIIFYMNIQKV